MPGMTTRTLSRAPLAAASTLVSEPRLDDARDDSDEDDKELWERFKEEDLGGDMERSWERTGGQRIEAIRVMLL